MTPCCSSTYGGCEPGTFPCSPGRCNEGGWKSYLQSIWEEWGDLRVGGFAR